MKKYICLAATALLLAACNHDNEVSTSAAGEVALQVNASISGVATRAAGTTWAENDRIGITTTSTTRTQYTNIPYKWDGTAFGFDDEKGANGGIYFQDTDPVTFSAYYPFTGIAASELIAVEKTITAEDQKSDNRPLIDFLFTSGATASKASPAVNFTDSYAFQHVMSQITFTFINGSDVELEGNLTEYTLGGLVLEGTFDTKTGIAGANEGADADNLTLEPEETVTTTDGQYTAAPIILFPQSAATASLSVKVDGENYSATLTIPSGALEAGKNYVYPVTVSKTGLIVGAAEIADWTEVSGGDTVATM